uniref:pancreatic secretory granule membrane major glycoprotein GP2-like n=1 Tax=Pristiophorus japonicus TaxID=55135 RepID=UPI00398EF452
MRTLLLLLSYLITDSALTDPCVDHTILDQPWRSTECIETHCTGKWMCDDNLARGWYRFIGTGGWRIPEVTVPEMHCSTKTTGWLNGHHPSVEQGAVTRTLCFRWYDQHCFWSQNIKIKNCGKYFVYELQPIPVSGCDKVYCTDPATSPTQGPEEQSTRESTDLSSTIPTESPSSDPATSPTQGPEEQSTRESTDLSSTIPTESPSS